MRDETRIRSEVDRELRAQMEMAAALWCSERAKLGFGVKWIGKPGARAMRSHLRACLNAGVEYRDLEAAIKVVAALPHKSPYDVMTVAFAFETDRRNEEGAVRAVQARRRQDAEHDAAVEGDRSEVLAMARAKLAQMRGQ